MTTIAPTTALIRACDRLRPPLLSPLLSLCDRLRPPCVRSPHTPKTDSTPHARIPCRASPTAALRSARRQTPPIGRHQGPAISKEPCWESSGTCPNDHFGDHPVTYRHQPTRPHTMGMSQHSRVAHVVTSGWQQFERGGGRCLVRDRDTEKFQPSHRRRTFRAGSISYHHSVREKDPRVEYRTRARGWPRRPRQRSLPTQCPHEYDYPQKPTFRLQS
jgi:hypothetical protein